jgi:2,4-dienoyl-CoA reductase-like NADH-dependent reductase (Old Yellow Enzyme family)
MKSEKIDRRQFIKITAGSALAMMSNSSPALFAEEPEPKTRSHYKVFSKGKIGNLQIKNRLIKAASATAATTGECRFLNGGIEMYRDWSKGGVGLIHTGHMTVTPIPAGAYNHKITCIYDDRFVPQLNKIADAVHKADGECKIVAQLNHIGPHSKTYPVAASSISLSGFQRKPRALTTFEVQEIRDAFVAAARRAKEAEFDGVEIHGAHGYLLNTFLSPYANKRTDVYGGSLENRVRLVTEIVDQIKTSVGPDFTVLIKTNCNDRQGVEGINADNFPHLAQEIEKTGVDAIEISGAMPARKNIDEPEKQSYFAGYAENLELNIPVILTGGNKSIDVIERICQQEKVDFFGFARPLIAEPDLPNRWLKMVGDTKCECISCNQCLSYLFTGQNLVTCQVL